MGWELCLFGSVSTNYKTRPPFGLFVFFIYLCSPKGRMAEWLKALVSKTGIPFTGYRGFESPFFRKRGNGIAAKAAVLFFVGISRRMRAFRALPSGISRRMRAFRALPSGISRRMRAFWALPSGISRRMLLAGWRRWLAVASTEHFPRSRCHCQHRSGHFPKDARGEVKAPP